MKETRKYSHYICFCAPYLGGFSQTAMHMQDHWSTRANTTCYLCTCTTVWSYQHMHIAEHKQTLRTHSSLPDSGCDEPAERVSLSGHKYVQCQDIQLAIPSPAESLADCFFYTFPATHAGVQYTQQKTQPCTHACTAQDYNAHTVMGGLKGRDICQRENQLYTQV